MKRFYSRIIVFILVSILLVTAFTGCRAGDDGVDEPEFVFVPEITSLSSLAGIFPNIHNIKLTENALYFTTTTNTDNTTLFRTTKIVKVDLEISDISNLSNYSTLYNYITAPPPHTAEGGNMHITAMQINSNGDLWVAETSRYVTFDFPPGFNMSEAEESDIWGHHKLLELTYTLRKLDNTGAELLSINVDHLALSNTNWAGITAFHADDDGNIIIGSGQMIYVLDTNGDIQFNIHTEEVISSNSFIELSDGRVAYKSWSNRNMATTLRVIDINNKELGTVIEFPIEVSGIFNGYDEYLVVFSDLTHLLAIDKSTGDTVQIFNWATSGVVSAGIDNILFLPDDRILLTATSLESDGKGQYIRHTDLMIFTKELQDETREKTVITIASYAPYIISDAVVEFNRTNALYQIEIKETDYTSHALVGDLNKFALEMITGGGPDIIHTTYVPFHQWAGHGFFVDLYEFIDADQRLDRSDFLESVLRNFEINGKLYHMSYDFLINTIIGHPDIVGSDPGWSIDEFRAVLDKNPKATRPLGELVSGIGFLWNLIRNDITSFIDWENGKVFFDTDYFINLLEFIYELESRIEIDLDEVDFSGGFHVNRSAELISSGEQILELVQFTDFWRYFMYQQQFGGDFVFKGYPVENGSGSTIFAGSSMAITTTSNNKDGAWEFIRMVLSEEWQSRQIQKEFSSFNIPTNKNVFEQSLIKAMEEVSSPPMMWNGIFVQIKPLTHEQVDDLRTLVDSASNVYMYTDPLEHIIRESLNDFFDGVITAQDAARIIQNRASIFVAEQSR